MSIGRAVKKRLRNAPTAADGQGNRASHSILAKPLVYVGKYPTTRRTCQPHHQPLLAYRPAPIAHRMQKRQDIVLAAALRCAAPLVRLLIRNGVTYPALAAALKPLFVHAADAEIARLGMKRTDSAVTLLSGVHRKDVRDMHAAGARAAEIRKSSAATHPPLSLVGQVVAAWQIGRRWSLAGRARTLPRSGVPRSFDALVASVSQDVRPRAMLAEMLRLGVVLETPDGLTLQASGFVPRQGFDAMGEAMALNLHDHAAAATDNLLDDARWLEQAVYVDDVGDESVAHLHTVARQAWQTAFATVMSAAQARFDHDAAHLEPQSRTRRARFGVYFYAGEDPGAKRPPPPQPREP